MKKWWTAFPVPWFELTLVIGLTLIGLWLRLYNLGETMSFTYDQGRDLLVLAEMAGGNLRLIGPTTGIGGLFLGPLLYYFLLPGFILTHGSPIGVAIWNAFLITLSLPLFYVVLRPLVGKKLALVGLGLLMITPGALEQARLIWNPSLTVPTLLISYAALFASKQKPWLLGLSLFAFGLSLQTELAYTVFLSLLYGVWILAYGPWSKKRYYSWPVLLVAAGAFGLTLLPQVLFEVKNQFLMTRSLMTEFSDHSRSVSFQTVLLSRPGLMFVELRRQLFADAAGSNWLLVLVTGIALSLAAVINKTAEERWWLATLVVPLLGMMLFRGNHGAFFGYYISAHYVPILAVVILAVHRWPLTGKLAGFKVPWRWIGVGVVTTALSWGLFTYLPLVLQPQHLGYTIQHEIKALEYVYAQQPTNIYAFDLFVPNLLPVQYTYLHQWLLTQRGQEPQAPLILESDRTYYLISEPAFAGASQISYDEWHERMTRNVTCEVDHQFGIVTVEKCVR